MSLDFGKWLKDKQQTQTKCVRCGFPNLHIPIITIKDLGEWGWNKVIALLKENGFPGDWVDGDTFCFVESFFDDEESNDYIWQIAVACLGKAEVEKRLKAVK